MPPVSSAPGLNIDHLAVRDGHPGLSVADVFLGILQSLQGSGNAGQPGPAMPGYTGGGGGGGGCSGSGAAGYGSMLGSHGAMGYPAMGYPATGYGSGGPGGLGSLLGGLGGPSMGGHGGSSMGGYGSLLGMGGLGGLLGMGHHGVSGMGHHGGGYGLGLSGYGQPSMGGGHGSHGGPSMGYGTGAGRLDLGGPMPAGHMGRIHSMFDHHDGFTMAGYGRYMNLGASLSREGNVVTQQGTIRSHPELVQLATRQALEEDPNLAGQALYRDVAKRLTGYNNGGNGVAGAFGLTEDEANDLGRSFNHRLHDISAGGQQVAQRLADNPAEAVAMYNNGTLGQVAAVGQAGDTWRIEGGHTLQEDSLQSRAIGTTADGQVLYENTVKSKNGANNGHDQHQKVMYSAGGPVGVEIVDNNQAYALERVDEQLVDEVASGGSVNNLPVFGAPAVAGYGGGHGGGHGAGMGGMGGYGGAISPTGGMGYGSGMTVGYDPFGAGRPADPATNLLNWLSHALLPTPSGPTLPTTPGGSGGCPRTGGPSCGCNGNVSGTAGISVFPGHTMH